jgi:ADP-ribosylglycohydrolase
MSSKSVKTTIEKNGILTSGGYHDQPIGTWSDDTSLTMATVESVIYCKGADLNDLSSRFVNWYEYEYWSCGPVFDCGRTTSHSIMKLHDSLNNGHLSNEDFIKCGGSGLMDNGNGSLMRILPLGFLQFNDDHEFIQTVTVISSLTHAHKMSTTSCVALCYFFKDLFKTNDYLKSWINTLNFLNSHDLISDLTDLKIIVDLDGFLKSDYPSKNPNTGFVITTLQTVLWSLMNGRNYEETIKLAISCDTSFASS